MQRKEILRAILFPSEVVSDQFQTYSVLTIDGRTFTGIVGVGQNSEELIILPANGKKVMIKKADVEESIVNKQSAMPRGTLEQLSQEEIRDLFNFLCAGPER